MVDVIRSCNPHLLRQSRLITDSRWNSTEKRGNFRVGLDKSENIVHEKEDVFLHGVSEIFGHGQAGESHSGPRPRHLVHLPENKGCLGKHPRFFHFMIKLIPLADPLPHAGENRIPAVVGGNIANQFLYQNSLADARPAKQANFASLDERGHQVNGLDARFKNFTFGFCVLNSGGFWCMESLRFESSSGAPPSMVSPRTLKKTAKHFLADRHRYRLA